MEKIDIHFVLDKELLDLIDQYSKEKYLTRTKTLEYFIKRGMDFDSFENYKSSMDNNMNKISKDLKFLKKLIIQMFVNKGFATNRKIKDDEAYNDFINSLNKDKLVD